MLFDKTLEQTGPQATSLRDLAGDDRWQLLVISNDGNVTRALCQRDQGARLSCHACLIQEDDREVYRLRSQPTVSSYVNLPANRE
jgi:hypothetical protein